MSTLILHLPQALPGPSTRYRYAVTADGHQLLRHDTAAPALLPEPGRPGEIVAVVPAQALSWHRVALPPGLPLGTHQPSPRLRAALEGLLEERLLDEPAQLHFALQPDARHASPCWVAVCERAWLSAHLQALEAARRPVSRVVPEFAPGATEHGGQECTALGPEDDARLVVCGPGDDDAVLLLPLAMASTWVQHSPDTPAPIVQAEPAVAAQAERLLGQPVRLQSQDERLMAAARGRWDLAQFELASSAQRRAMRQVAGVASSFLYAPQWRAARWGVCAFVAAHLVGLNAWAWQERQSLQAKQAAVRATLQQTFPKVQVVVDAPAQMEREVALLRQAAGQLGPRDAESLLAGLARALPEGRAPTALEYSGAELRLQGLSFAPDELQVVQSRLQPLGLRLRDEAGRLVLQADGPR
ncbi:MAG: type II secretion system protein GspL [Burkholderiaceae bacterium]